MAKVIRLTESDLTRLVKRIVEDSEIDGNSNFCAKAVNNFAKANGFKDRGTFGDGEMHAMDVRYKKNSEFVRIAIIDWFQNDFMVEISGSDGNKIIRKYYPTLKNNNLNCKTIKNEIVNKIKPLEQELLRMGYKKTLNY